MIAHRRVAVAMSGGVDSSTAAAILCDQGYDLVGFSMQLWDQRRRGPNTAAPRSSPCCSLEDFHDARAVAARLGFPYYIVNFEGAFEEKVVKSFVEDYCRGLTPSPCVLCNSHLKFDHLFRMGAEVRAERVATGHYARVEFDSATGRYRLLRARDLNKDQSYFLFELSQDQLARALFPLGELTKAQVRDAARRFGLDVADKPDSQELCFVPDGDYAGFIDKYLNELGGDEELRPWIAPGDIVDAGGRRLGTHSGIHRFTVGQRRGLGIAHSAPLYVLELHPEERTVVVGEWRELCRRSCLVAKANWVGLSELNAPRRVMAKIRSRHREAAATVSARPDGSVLVEFDSPQMAITPGQACVFYEGDIVLGGGWIARG
jgi:tRNA-uridine 2-sulfurtransferase